MQHDQQQNYTTFMGLNESYNGARSQIVINMLHSINQVYFLINQEESQRKGYWNEQN